MIKKQRHILVLGDSYIYGHGCQDRVHYFDASGAEHGTPENLTVGPSDYAWPSLLASRYPDKVKVTNLSMPGMDNLSLMSVLCNFMDNNSDPVDLVIFNSTPPARMVVRNNSGNTLKDTPYLSRLIDLNDSKKSANWQIFREGRPESLNGGSNVDPAFLKFAGLYYHDALGWQMATASILSALTICQTQGIKFIWMSPNYCATQVNLPLLPTKARALLQDKQCTHISNFQRQNLKLYSADDGHSNEQCHEDYFNEIVKAKIAGLGLF